MRTASIRSPGQLCGKRSSDDRIVVDSGAVIPLDGELDEYLNFVQWQEENSMRDTLQNLCNRFIAGRQVVKGQFNLESSYIYPICARGTDADAEILASCKKLFKERTGVFSNFRGNLTAERAVIAATVGSTAASSNRSRNHAQTL